MIRWIDQLGESVKASALCVGSFDGVHVGHKALVKKALEESPDGLAYGLSFSPHPKEFFLRENASDSEFKRILPEDTNELLLKREGLKDVFYVQFDKGLSKKSADEFLNHVKSYIDFSSLVVGFDFRLGNQRLGGQEELVTWCDKNNVKFVSVEKIEKDSLKVSSTLVRKCLEQADFKKVEQLLGHDYFLEGEVFKDQGLGKKLGFPTLNIKLPSNLALRNGVYTALVQIETNTYHAVVNFGKRPTVGSDLDYKILEVHILEKDFLGSEKPIRVFLKTFLRSEKKFKDLQDLSLQVEKDIIQSRGFFNL